MIIINGWKNKRKWKDDEKNVMVLAICIGGRQSMEEEEW